MQSSLAIYEALVQAGVTAPSARRVAEALEHDMTSTLATKSDVQQLALATTKDFLRMDQRFASMQQVMDQRFASMQQVMDQRFASMQQVMDQRFATVDQRFNSLEGLMAVRFGAMEQRIEGLETRLVLKLGALITGLFAIAGALLTLVR